LRLVSKLGVSEHSSFTNRLKSVLKASFCLLVGEARESAKMPPISTTTYRQREKAAAATIDRELAAGSLRLPPPVGLKDFQ
jgi:hypothetical protein